MTINGKEYAWAEMQIVVSGKVTPLIGVTEVSYGSRQSHSPIYGKGRDPYGMQSGNKEYSGTLGLKQSEVEALQKTLAAGKDITDIRNYNITVAYLPEGAGQIVTDQILDVRFGEVQKGMRSGDGSMDVQLSFNALKVNYNI